MGALINMTGDTYTFNGKLGVKGQYKQVEGGSRSRRGVYEEGEYTKDGKG